jgi:predicted O-methyltransferase YrrM
MAIITLEREVTEMPEVHLLSQYHSRTDVLKMIANENGIGVELGVAEGHFSRMILKEFEETDFYLYSIDMWAGDRGHDIEQYKTAVVNLEPWKRSNTILKMTFDEALPLFPDDYFDFIYVDGYAHTGEGGGKYFRDWWPKLRVGGVFAGDDYHQDWPLVIKEVNRFAIDVDHDIFVIPNRIEGDPWSQYPSWFLQKKG